MGRLMLVGVAFVAALGVGACGHSKLDNGEECSAASDCKSGECSPGYCGLSGVCVDRSASPGLGLDPGERCIPTGTITATDTYETSEATTDITGVLLDTPSETTTTGTAEGGTGSGCEKIDFLFVLDNSGSMNDEQERLVAAFPGFLDAIRTNVQGQDHHIMVVDSDENGAWVCEEFQDGGHCGSGLQQPNCEGYVCGTAASLPQCARDLGAGIRYAYGGRTANADCNYPAGRRYLTSDDINLDTAFACAAKVGTSGNSVERPMSAMAAALSSPNTDAGGCNEGFLREDAILVVTIVTDDPPIGMGDDAQQTDPMPWYQAIVDAKQGDIEAAVVIGFLPTQDVSCVVTGEPTPVFEEFMTLLGDQGVSASVCDTDYATVFSDAISTIDEACETFMPPG